MAAKRNFHLVFERKFLPCLWEGILKCVFSVTEDLWGPIKFTMTHDYEQGEARESVFSDMPLPGRLDLSPTELVFFYPEIRSVGSVSVQACNRSLLVSVSIDAARPLVPRDLITLLWNRVSDFKPVVAVEGVELEVDPDALVEPRMSADRLRDLDLCELAVLRRSSDLPSEIRDGYLVECVLRPS